MKKTSVILFTLVCLSLIAHNAMAYPVEMISSNFSIKGFYDGAEWIRDQNGNGIGMKQVTDSYDLDSSSPAESNVSYTDIDGNYYYSKASVDYFSAYAEAETFEYGADATASAIFIFRPLAHFDQITVHKSGYMYSTITANLIDITANQQIWNVYHDLLYQALFNQDEEINYNFRTDHIYQLRFDVNASANRERDMASIYTNDLNPVFSSVPEPATMLLLGLGLIGLAGIEKKIKAK